MRNFLLGLLFALIAPVSGEAQTLDVYFVDVEGGQATLVVSPSGESMLVDAGWPGFNGRDAGRIVAAVRAAGVERIDYMLVTHYHPDHVGGVLELAERIPILNFVDHGPSVETGKNAEELFAAYKKVSATGHRLRFKPGDRIPIKGIDVQVVASAGEVIASPLDRPGAKNPLCVEAEPREEDTGENAQSVGTLIHFGKFRLINLADLTWNKELELACPVNRLGTVDVYLSTHHGMNLSGPRAIVHALRPRVAILNNGARKGGAPEAWQVIRNSPELEDIWQLHYALAGGKEHNAPEAFIANLEEDCWGYAIKLSAQLDGAFTVTNTRNGHSKTYPAR